ncbi:MAG: hypothetical protein AAGA00_12475, partial [Pseudomonadota bacterium]
ACDAAPAYLSLGRVSDARALLTRQSAMARRLNLKQFLAWITLRRAELSSAEGDRTQACDLAAQALAEAKEIGDLVLEPTALFVRARNSVDNDQDCKAALHLCKERGLKALATSETATATPR